MRLLETDYPELAANPTANSGAAVRRRRESMLHLAEIAVAYRALIAAGRPDPAMEISREFEVAPSTARSWIHRARRVGLLGPAVGATVGKGVDIDALRARAERVLALAEQRVVALARVDLLRDQIADVEEQIMQLESRRAEAEYALAEAQYRYEEAVELLHNQ